MTLVTKPASDQSRCASTELWKFGTMQNGLGVGDGDGVGDGEAVGAGVEPGSGVGDGDGDGDGDGVGLGDGVGGIAVCTGIPRMEPDRIGNAEEADTSTPFPRTKLRIGVIRWNRQVMATFAGWPIERPLGNVGFGIGEGRSQLMTSASAATCR